MQTCKMVAIATVFVGLSYVPVATQTGQQQQAGQPATQAPAKSGMTMDCQAMMASHQQMMEQMKAMDAKLDTLVQAMNSATGPAKTDAIAAVVQELVSQRKAMRDRMQQAQGGMMHHMMEHMQAGGGKGAMTCPMMQNMGGIK